MSADTLELAKERSRLTREQVLKVVDGLSDEQLAWRPSARAHSMGWTLWHIARCADKFAAEASGTMEIWQRERLADHWGMADALLGSNGVGTGVDDETAASLRPPRRDLLIDYAQRAFAVLDKFVGQLDPPGIEREHESFFTDGPASVGRALIASMAHDARHLGELEYVKGLLGLRGTATR
jgi:DinB family protein